MYSLNNIGLNAESLRVIFIFFKKSLDITQNIFNFAIGIPTFVK